MNSINQMVTGVQLIGKSSEPISIGMWLGKIVTYAVAHPVLTIAIIAIALAILIYCIYKPQVKDDQADQTAKPDQNAKPVQAPGSKTVRVYKGDLTDLEKSTIETNYDSEYLLKIIFKQHANINFTIRRENLFEAQAEVIVNAANDHLGGGGGIDGAIHDEGGKSYADAHRKLKIEYSSNYVLGHAAMVNSGELQEKYKINNAIIVAGPSGKTTKEKENQLYSCYFNSLELAHSQNKKSIAFPSVSTGIFSFPKDRAASFP